MPSLDRSGSNYAYGGCHFQNPSHQKRNALQHVPFFDKATHTKKRSNGPKTYLFGPIGPYRGRFWASTVLSSYD